MMILKMPEHTSEVDLLFATLRAEVIAHICATGQNLCQAKKIWLYSVLKELWEMAEYSSTPLIPNSLQTGLGLELEKLEEELNV